MKTSPKPHKQGFGDIFSHVFGKSGCFTVINSANTRQFSRFRLFSCVFKNGSKNEMNFKKQRKTERNREKS